MRGLEKNLVILDRKDYNLNRKYIKNPAITRVMNYGNGWIDVEMSDGFIYRRTGGTISWRYNNPGNIKFGQFARMHKAVGPGWGKHAVFPTYEIGKWAKKQLLFTPIRRYYNLSIAETMKYYAPVGDGQNNPAIYSRYVVNRVNGVTLDTKLRDMTPTQQDQMLVAMERFEGWRPGKVTRIR